MESDFNTEEDDLWRKLVSSEMVLGIAGRKWEGQDLAVVEVVMVALRKVRRMRLRLVSYLKSDEDMKEVKKICLVVHELEVDGVETCEHAANMKLL